MQLSTADGNIGWSHCPLVRISLPSEELIDDFHRILCFLYPANFRRGYRVKMNSYPWVSKKLQSFVVDDIPYLDDPAHAGSRFVCARPFWDHPQILYLTRTVGIWLPQMSHQWALWTAVAPKPNGTALCLPYHRIYGWEDIPQCAAWPRLQQLRVPGWTAATCSWLNPWHFKIRLGYWRLFWRLAFLGMIVKFSDTIEDRQEPVHPGGATLFRLGHHWLHPECSLKEGLLHRIEGEHGYHQFQVMRPLVPNYHQPVKKEVLPK